LVRRLRLEARLDRALSRSLTVVAALAGHGKTSTIVSWLRLRQLDAAWVSVDRRDADLTRFATHVAAALDRIAAGAAPELFALLAAPDRLAPRDLGEAFGEALYDLDAEDHRIDGGSARVGIRIPDQLPHEAKTVPAPGGGKSGPAG
jgi:ATP/maltotriose-dependent transcriptional regulator MalT